ncbi:Uncharacterised protein [Mycobacteroides abscessus]|nr:Uncharacterised protein [Mycobacteroides abscessus]
MFSPGSNASAGTTNVPVTGSVRPLPWYWRFSVIFRSSSPRRTTSSPFT